MLWATCYGAILKGEHAIGGAGGGTSRSRRLVEMCCDGVGWVDIVNCENMNGMTNWVFS